MRYLAIPGSGIKDRYSSFTNPQFGFKLESGKLYLSKIGDVKIKLHGIIKRLTLRMVPTGKWFFCFSIETGVTLPSCKEGPIVGVNVGLENFAALVNLETIENPRLFRAREKELARIQREYFKAPKGYSEWMKGLNVVERVHVRIANRRPDTINKVSCELVDRFGVTAFEDLSIKNMLKNHNLVEPVSYVFQVWPPS